MLTPALSNQPVLFGSTAVMMSNEATKPSNECIGINASCSTTTSSICPKQLHMRKAFPDDYPGVRFTTCYGHVQKAEDTLTVYFTTKKANIHTYIYIPLRSITDIWGYPNFGQTFITFVFKSRSETSVCVCVWTCDAGKAWCGARYKTVSSQRGFTWYEATPFVGTARLASFFSASHWLVTSCQTESWRGVAKERAHEWPIQRSDVLGIPNWKKVLAMHWTWLYNIVHRSQVPITLICWHVSYTYLHYLCYPVFTHCCTAGRFWTSVDVKRKELQPSKKHIAQQLSRW